MLIIVLLLLIYFVAIPLLFCGNIDFDLTKSPQDVSCVQNSDCISKSCGCLNEKGASRFDFLTNFCGVRLHCVKPSICTCENNKCVAGESQGANNKKATTAEININNAITDCGAVEHKNASEEEKIKECFEQKFKECKPAKMAMTIDLEQAGGLTTYYGFVAQIL